MTSSSSLRYAAVLLLAAAPSWLPAQSFEGSIAIRMASGAPGGSPAQDIEYLARGGNVRVTMASPMGTVAILGLAAEQKTFVVIDAQKSYMELSAATAGTAVPDARIERTGRKEIIAGLECEHVVVETSGANGPQRSDVCLTKALGPFLNPLSALSGARLPAWQRQLVAEGAFPLKVTIDNGTVALEVTKVTKRRVADTMFRIPDDFSKMDMPRRP